jgi:hypothetical protein
MQVEENNIVQLQSLMEGTSTENLSTLERLTKILWYKIETNHVAMLTVFLMY